MHVSKLALAAFLMGRAGVVVMDAASRISQLQDEHAQAVADYEAIIQSADEDERDLTDDELTKVTELRAKAEKLHKQIQARQAIAPPPSQGRRTTPEPNRDPGGRVPAEP